MELIDSHAHLDFDSFAGDLQEVLQRAWQAGLERIVTIGLGREGAARAIDLAAGEERIFCTVGVHPHDSDLEVNWRGDPQAGVEEATLATWQTERDALMDDMRQLAGEQKTVAIGEVGLDYHYDHSPRELQKRLFRSFIQLAAELQLPLVIHSREAVEDTIEILSEEKASRVGGVIHCYGGDPRLGRAALDMGFYLGLAGPLTFKKADALRQAAADLPLDRLLVETDSPYLAPVPYRGKRNEPAYVAEVGHQTAENARLLFGL